HYSRLLYSSPSDRLDTLSYSNDTATSAPYTLSLHDALPISTKGGRSRTRTPAVRRAAVPLPSPPVPVATPWRNTALSSSGLRSRDRKSTRLNSSHGSISYAVFCLKKKTHTNKEPRSIRQSTL